MKKDAIHPAVPYLVVPVGILAVSTASLLIRFAQEYVPSITIAAFRMGLAALILLPYTSDETQSGTEITFKVMI